MGLPGRSSEHIPGWVHSRLPSPALRDTARQSSLQALLRAKTGGAEGIRTPDPHNAIVVLYQLSYDPIQSGENLRTHPLFVKAIQSPNILLPSSVIID
jgi:hypothetical protein